MTDPQEMTDEEVTELMREVKAEIAERFGTRTEIEENSTDPDLDKEIADAGRNLGDKRNFDRSLGAKSAKLNRLQGRTNVDGLPGKARRTTDFFDNADDDDSNPHAPDLEGGSTLEADDDDS